MSLLRILLADDDAGMRAVMQKIVEKADGYAIAGVASDGLELMRLYEAEHPDVVLMDVEMPGMTGLECARAIQDENPRTVLVFATAHDQYMADAFSVYAFDYLLKPFKVERALETLARIRDRLAQPAPEALKPSRQEPAPLGRLMLRHREGIAFVDVGDILLIQREDRASVLYLSDGSRFITSDTLTELEARLPGETFFRTHKSYIVNLSQIDSISPYGRWTYIVKLRGTDRDALITHERFEELEKRFA